MTTLVETMSRSRPINPPARPNGRTGDVDPASLLLLSPASVTPEMIPQRPGTTRKWRLDPPDGASFTGEPRLDLPHDTATMR